MKGFYVSISCVSLPQCCRLAHSDYSVAQCATKTSGGSHVLCIRTDLKLHRDVFKVSEVSAQHRELIKLRQVYPNEFDFEILIQFYGNVSDLQCEDVKKKHLLLLVMYYLLVVLQQSGSCSIMQ